MKKIFNLYILTLCYVSCLAYEVRPLYTTSQHMTTQSRYVSFDVSTGTMCNYSTSRQGSIGYTTNSNICRTSSLQPFNYRNTQLNTYSNQSTRSSRPSPRKVIVYNGKGEERNAPGDQEGVYQYDENTGIWYYSSDSGTSWYEWRSARSFWESISSDGVLASLRGLFNGYGTTWRTPDNQPSENSSKWASDPEDPFLDPIGEPYILLALLAGYTIYKRRDKLEG